MKKAFTLIELLIVIIIIGILATIAIPQYEKMVQRAKIAGALPKLQQIMTAEKLYYMEHGAYSTIVGPGGAHAPDWESIDIDNPCDSHFVYVFYDYPSDAVITYKMRAACAIAGPNMGGGEGWGDPGYYQVAISVDGRIGVMDTDQNFEIWSN